MTAKEFIEKMTSENESVTTEVLMIEFAKMHASEALKSAHYAAVSTLDGRAWDCVYNKRFLLLAYPDSKII
jgi:hypothetical protein